MKIPKQLTYSLTVLIAAFSFCIQGCSDEGSTPQPQLSANFTVDIESIIVGESITFTDISFGEPTSWEWTFEGGTPSSSTDQNPEITFEAPGLFDVTLKVTNAGSEDSKTENDFIEVTCECSSECKESCTETLLTNQTVSVDGRNRRFDLFLPSAYSYSTELPVIIDLHGYTSSGSEQREISNFENLAESNSIIMAWPEALESGTSCIVPGVSGKYWNANWGDDTDDVLFIDRLIDQLIADYNVDAKRIYVTGLSNGGFMAYSVACSLSSKIAAVASVAGSMTDNLLTSVCQPDRQLPVLHIHGTNDTIIPWEGLTECLDGVAAIEDVVSFWRTNAGCDETFTEIAYDDTDTSDGCTARMLTYENCENKVSFLIIDNGGHNWPGSSYQMNQGFSILLPINNDIDANEEIWEFFQQHELP